MKKTCLIVDDEPPALKVLESYIKQIQTLELAGKCSNAFEAMRGLSERQVDILFLDIKMPQLSGVEFLRSLRNPPKVIFTTAYKEYAVEAFDLEAADYLLKPVSLERFIKAINKVCSREDGIPEYIQEEAGSKTAPFLYFRADRKMVKVMLDTILYVESLKDYIKIIRENDKPLVVKQTITSMEDMLPANKFVRIHRSFIVAINKVTAFTQLDIEIGGIEIPIGRAYSNQVKLLSK
ncbi:MAG: LytTR family DNA-binding domain-containing protein [Bacteroidota bacterium]|nr:LytTR family DNA-binding domain-containing protein [Bacteroidota bacterium]